MADVYLLAPTGTAHWRAYPQCLLPARSFVSHICAAGAFVRGLSPLCGLIPLTLRPVTFFCGSTVGGRILGRGTCRATHYSWVEPAPTSGEEVCPAISSLPA